MQSTLQDRLHVGIIMDGNGRWATERGSPRVAGHRAGVAATRRVVAAAAGAGIGTLTLYAFSSDNWRRPPDEVTGMMELLRHYLQTEAAHLARAGIRLSVIGRRDRLPAGLAEAMGRAEHLTSAGNGLHLRIAIDYSGRAAILAAAGALAGTSTEPGSPSAAAFGRAVSGEPIPDVDLVIRTSGEQRLSDFLLWESAYAELHFTSTHWPDFGPEDLAAALRAFSGRTRRFGGLAAPARAA
ncbi:UDP pyrophosphate synthase [Methylobacterium sp. Leaf104]|uniref:di-trans,poly-cis-decaprenylcistransferase n=1 Tax=Methylobacterium TaxID=407 RepID=UPI0006F48374|nr:MULTISPECIES: di-trans,poly-cis-decaprenylcistransferase [Methylobacterium]KQP41087.1 UDP pyrophosphate synthase [Methylobacterium sp. Leaf104]MCI9882516.1 di-trans,poly-cis-decaprenylcistransferase [Methylobacterium goesingense]